MKKKLVIFDMDGTLINSSITIANAINYVRENLGLEPLDIDFILSKVNDNSINPAQVFYHTKTFEKDQERWFSQYYSRNHARELALYDGIEELLKDLKQNGFKLAVATNAYRSSTIESLTHFKIWDLFDTIACADDVKRPKPQPNMLFKILDELNISKEDAIFVGDGERDEEASKKADIDYIMVDWGFSDYSNAVKTIQNLKSLLI